MKTHQDATIDTLKYIRQISNLPIAYKFVHHICDFWKHVRHTLRDKLKSMSVCTYTYVVKSPPIARYFVYLIYDGIIKGPNLILQHTPPSWTSHATFAHMQNHKCMHNRQYGIRFKMFGCDFSVVVLYTTFQWLKSSIQLHISIAYLGANKKRPKQRFYEQCCHQSNLSS